LPGLTGSLPVISLKTRAAGYDAHCGRARIEECSALFAPLVTAPDRPAPASAEYRQRKAQLIRSILADDARIRALVELPDSTAATES
jgi:hypothetical protein